jgi:DNA-binding GntR family transcriptional regulator
VPEPPDLRARCRTVDDGFHEAVVAALRNPLIADVYRQTKARVLVIRLDQGYQLTPVMIRDTMAEHGAVLAALARHDRDGAVAAMDEHLTRALHRAMGV